MLTPRGVSLNKATQNMDTNPIKTAITVCSELIHKKASLSLIHIKTYAKKKEKNTLNLLGKSKKDYVKIIGEKLKIKSCPILLQISAIDFQYYLKINI